MIYTDSRYASGNLLNTYAVRNNTFNATVFRVFPSSRTDYFLYTWKEGDRIDLVTKGFLGTAALWWKVMDFNPEILNPADIPVGTVLRIPNVR